MIFKLLCFLIFTPEAKRVYQPNEMHNVDKNIYILHNAQKHYLNEHFASMKTEHDKLVMVSAIVYNSNLYKTENTTLNSSIYFKNILDQDIDILLSKMVTTRSDFTPYTSHVVTYDIVEYYVGNNFIPNEENIMSNNYDKCMIVYL
jgi:hypothetical protein